MVQIAVQVFKICILHQNLTSNNGGMDFKMKLTDTKIKGLKPIEKRVRITDGNNLALMVEPNGRKYFIVRYKSPISGKIRTFNIGNYPTISLQNARKKALEIKEDIMSGIDPMNKNDDLSFKNIATEYINLKENRVSKRHFERCHRMLELYIYNHFGQSSIEKIDANLVISTLKNLEKFSKMDTLQKTLGIVKEVFEYAHMRGYIAQNPVSSIKRNVVFKKYTAQNYPTITDKAEIKNLLTAITLYQGDIRTITALKLSILTANRPFNIRSAQWSEINLKDKIWTIPAEKMKMKIEHILPLSSQAVELLKEFGKLNFDSEYLFPSILSKSRCMSDNTINTALRRLGYTKDIIVAHGFRAMFSTIAHENQHIHNMSSEVIEQCLAHKTGDKVKSAYDRSLRLEQRRILMQWWADYLDKIYPFLATF